MFRGVHVLGDLLVFISTIIDCRLQNKKKVQLIVLVDYWYNTVE